MVAEPDVGVKRPRKREREGGREGGRASRQVEGREGERDGGTARGKGEEIVIKLQVHTSSQTTNVLVFSASQMHIATSMHRRLKTTNTPTHTSLAEKHTPYNYI